MDIILDKKLHTNHFELQLKNVIQGSGIYWYIIYINLENFLNSPSNEKLTDKKKSLKSGNTLLLNLLCSNHAKFNILTTAYMDFFSFHFLASTVFVLSYIFVKITFRLFQPYQT